MEKERPLGKRAETLLSKLKNGAVLCCEVDDTEEGRRNSCRRWFLESGGSSVGPATASRLVKRGLVQPNTARLFHDFDEQTYVCAS